MKVIEALIEYEKRLMPTEEEIKAISTIFEEYFKMIPDKVIKKALNSGLCSIGLSIYNDKCDVTVGMKNNGEDQDRDTIKKYFGDKKDLFDKMKKARVDKFDVELDENKVSFIFSKISLPIEVFREIYPSAECYKWIYGYYVTYRATQLYNS